MLKNWQKTFENVKIRKKNLSKISKNREKCPKTGKTVKNVEKLVKNRLKYRKIVKNLENYEKQT